MDVLVCSPVWRSFEAANVLALFNLMANEGFSWHPLVNDADIARARSRGATHFLEQTSADVCLWIDSDIDFREQDAITICEQALDPATPIVCGIYPTRSSSEAMPASRLLLDHPYTFGTDPTPQPILWAAGGFTAVHRRVYAELAGTLPTLHPDSSLLRMYPFYAPMPGTAEDGSLVWLSEDWSLSERARLAGFGSYANCAVDLAHVGTYRYTLANLFTVPKVRRPIRFTRRARHNVVERNPQGATANGHR